MGHSAILCVTVQCDTSWCSVLFHGAVCCVMAYLECPGVDEVLGTVDTIELSQAGLVVVNLDMVKIQLEGGGSQEGGRSNKR